MTKLELAKELIKEKSGKDGKCTLSKKKLGELLHKRYPSVFQDAENGRLTVRRVTGSNGVQNRKIVKIRHEWKGLSLPEPEKNDYSKFQLNSKRIGILSDIHFPYYDKISLNAAISYLKKWKPDCILLNGDIIDCYQISDYCRDPRMRPFKYELDMLRNFFLELQRVFPKARIIYKTGNHCDRYEKKILQRVPEFLDLEWTKFEYVIGAKELGIDVVKNKRLIQIGRSLNVAHGHEFGKQMIAPINPARGFYMKANANIIGGHHHRTSEHIETDVNGKTTAAWSTGSLCDLHPDYMPINKWNSGFATVENYNTDFSVKNLKIINGKVL